MELVYLTSPGESYSKHIHFAVYLTLSLHKKNQVYFHLRLPALSYHITQCSDLYKCHHITRCCSEQKILGCPADHPLGTLGGPHKFWVVWQKILKKKYLYFDNHNSNIAALSGTIGHGVWQQQFLGYQSDQYLVIHVSGSPNRFIGSIWRPGACLATALITLVLLTVHCPWEQHGVARWNLVCSWGRSRLMGD